MSDTLVRRAVAGDGPSLALLNREFNGGADDWHASSAGGGGEIVLIAMGPEGPVGFACVQVIRSACYGIPWAELTEIFVRPAARRRGIGRALMAMAEREALDAGAPAMILRTNHANEAAHAFYERIGFERKPDVVYGKELSERATS